MQIEWVRKLCKSLPHTTEQVQWGNNLVFKIGGKMFAVMALEPAPNWISFKVPDEDFAEFCEREGVIPAPYLARSHWIALQTEDAIGVAELKRLIRQSYDLVLAKLPKKTQAQLR